MKIASSPVHVRVHCCGSRQNVNIYGLAPDIKNMSTASMLYVFALWQAPRLDRAPSR